MLNEVKLKLKLKLKLSLHSLTDPCCDVLSNDREPCSPDLKAPFVNPGSCLSVKTCCYDDMFMREKEVKFYANEGRIWCFKKQKHS